jgi:hypothetical protein
MHRNFEHFYHIAWPQIINKTMSFERARISCNSFLGQEVATNFHYFIISHYYH